MSWNGDFAGEGAFAKLSAVSPSLTDMSASVELPAQRVGSPSRDEFRAAAEVLARYVPVGDPSALLGDIECATKLGSVLEAITISAAVGFRARRFDEAQAERAKKSFEAFVRSKDIMRGTVGEVALARKESPTATAHWIASAEVLTAQLPHTFDALASGRLTAGRAHRVVSEVRCLSEDDRGKVDVALGCEPGVETKSTNEIAAFVRTEAYRVDPRSVVERRRQAEADRCVSVRPVDDGMARLSVLTTLPKAVGMFAALSKEADAARSIGDARGRGQLQADIAHERLTGQSRTSPPRVDVQLVMNEQTMRGGSAPAMLLAPGLVPQPIPAAEAQQLIDDASATQTAVRIRRLWTDGADRLVAMDSIARTYPQGLQRFITTRDGCCRTPWCGAPIRHIDHVVEHADGGPTSEPNGQGLCERCNHIKQAPGWRARPGPGGAGHQVTVTTPTGRTYVSRPPRPPTRT